MRRAGSVAPDDQTLLPDPGVHPWAIFDDDGRIALATYSNNQTFALTYRTRIAAERTAARLGGTVRRR